MKQAWNGRPPGDDPIATTTLPDLAVSTEHNRGKGPASAARPPGNVKTSVVAPIAEKAVASTTTAVPGPAAVGDDDDPYVLYQAPGAARYPFLAAWVCRRRLSAGYLAEHAGRFARVLVIGAPDGLLLPHTCRVACVQAEEAERLFAGDPMPGELFGDVHHGGTETRRW
jgi:hypothetical protein